MSNDDKNLIRILHIADAISLINEFVAGVNFTNFNENKLIQSAVIRQFEIIGEASRNIDDEFKLQHPDLSWRILGDFRNFLIHEYFRIDNAEIWATIEHDLPQLKEQIEHLINFLRKV
jgi:uncharacterized protein with HEPN domain